jgi:hypothetical protein
MRLSLQSWPHVYLSTAPQPRVRIHFPEFVSFSGTTDEIVFARTRCDASFHQESLSVPFICLIIYT